MINFNCPQCNQKIKTNDALAYKQVRCPKCGQPIRVPAPAAGNAEGQAPRPAEGQSNIIKFYCPGCNQKIGLDKKFAGKTVKCAKCKTSFKVPGDKTPQAEPLPSVPKPPAAKAPVPTPFDKIDLDDMLDDNVFKEELNTAKAGAPPADGLLKLASQPQQEQQEQQAIQRRCPRCGAMNPADLPVCPMCAFEFSAATSRADTGGGSLNKKRCVIIAVAGIVILLVNIAVLWNVFSGFKNLGAEKGPRVGEAKQLAEQYVNHLKSGNAAGAKGLLIPGLQTNVADEKLDAMGKYIDAKNVDDVNLSLTHYEHNPQGDKYYLSYNLIYKDKGGNKDKGGEENEDGKYGSLIFSLCDVDKVFKIDGVAAENFSERPVSIGPRTYNELSTIIFTPAMTGLGAVLSRSCCAIVAACLIMIMVQVVSLWVVFNKAGYPGWAAIVPFYNLWVLAEVADKPGWMGLAVYLVNWIPYVGIVLSLVLSIVICLGVSKAFSRGPLFGLGLALLPFIFFPVLAFAVE